MVLLVVTLGSSVVRFASARATVTVVDSVPWTYRARVAGFGDQLEIGVVHDANLMLPPNASDPFLCEEPSLNLAWDSQTDLPGDENIAIFVSRGECSFETKARNARKIQKNVTSRLRYVIVYNNDRNFANDLVVMSASSPDEELEDLNNLGLIFVSTSTGSAIRRKISKLSESIGESAFFLSADSGGWRMPLLVERLPPTQSGPQPPFASGGNGGGSNGASTFYWLRFVLFALLVVAPCFRAFYLWYGGGGRLIFRRNDRGRITGLQYVRPQPYWFAGGPVSDSTNQHETELLTEEQVLALPEIDYQPPSPDTTEAEVVSSDVEEQVAADEEQPPMNAQESIEGGPPVNGEEEENFKTSCTTCSICIDDFEEGERIRLLPRCRHAFHTDCIMPWLTERQGSCPLCKTSVLQNEQDTATDAEELSEDSQS